MSDFFITPLESISIADLTAKNHVIAGLDIGDKRVGISISDRRICISSGVTTITRKGYAKDFELVKEALAPYSVGVIVFGWPVQMNGHPGPQCEKIYEFVSELSQYIPTIYSKWDERFSTKAVESIMIQANVSRKKRQQVIDKGAATYILQGAIDFLHKRPQCM